MRMGKAKAPALAMAGTVTYRRLRDMLMRFTRLPGATAACGPMAARTDECAGLAGLTLPCIDPLPALQRSCLSRPLYRSEDTPIRYLALGTASDRKGFIIAIRAFALAGKLGDHLTLAGYGRDRRCLEKWSIALGVDAVVTFAESGHASIPELVAYDSLILLSQRDARQIDVVVDGLSRGMSVISMSLEANVTERLRRSPLGRSIGSGEVLTLSSAMLAVKPADHDPVPDRMAGSGATTTI